jgi:phage tail sheath protein FI
MSAAFLHGIESLEVNVGPQPVTVVKSAVIGLIGTAPMWASPLAPSWYNAVANARQPGTVDAAAAWAASTAYVAGAKVIDANGNLQTCTTAGTSGSTAPGWARTIGGSTADGSTVVWALSQTRWNDSAAYFYPLWNPYTVYVVGDCVIDSNGNLQQATAAGVSGATAQTWATALNGATASDGTTAWKLVQLAAQVSQVNALVLVSGARDASGFGPLVRGYTIPYALDAIQKQGAGQVIVVNVFKPTSHVTAVSGQSGTFNAALQIALGHMGVSHLTITPPSGAITGVVISSGHAGTGYVVGDVLTVTTGGTGGTATVTQIGASGAVTGVELTSAGTGYSTGGADTTTDYPTNGTGCELDVTVATHYTAGVHYAIDAVNGVVTALPNSGIVAGAVVSAAFSYANPTDSSAGVVDADVIGTTTAGVSTGIKLLPYAYARFGFFPKILIAPSFSERQAVAAQLGTTAAKIRAVTWIDTTGGLSPVGGGSSEPTTSKTEPTQTPVVSTAIANRGDTSKAFGVSDKRQILLYPKVPFMDQGVDPTGADVINPTDGPGSAWAAGAMAARDIQDGYWWSASMMPIRGALGPDMPLIMSAFDPDADTQLLNGAGIVTFYSSFASGLALFGNQSSAYPASTHPDSFYCIRRTLDIVEESLELFSLQYLDGPISNALITAVLQSGNAFVRTLIARGAFVPGSKVAFDPDDNPVTELAAGHVTFVIDCMPPPPAQRITFKVKIDTNLLANITGSQNQAA